jgi:uncharacterized protein (TIGR03663 family)
MRDRMPVPVGPGRHDPGVCRRLQEIPRGERLAWAVLLVAALVVRLYDLGARAYHHDESQIAYFSWILAERGDYAYDPLLHGPVQYYASAATFTVLGDSDLTGRLPAVLGGMIAIALVFALRRFLGRVGAFAAAAAIAFGPSFLYYSRFIREDILLVAANLALLVVLSALLWRPRKWHPAALGLLLAVAFAIKEATFITVGVAVPFFVVWLGLAWRRARREGLDLRAHPLSHAVRSVGWEAWVWGLAAFLALYTLLFTTFLTEPQHWDALYEGLAYWREQHGVRRGEGEWYFYSVVLAGHEWPMLLLGAVGAAALLRRRSPFGAFLVWMFAGQFAAYSIAGERFTWLVLHPLVALTLLAGAGVQVIWDARARLAGRFGLAAVVLCAIYVTHASWLANARHPTDPVEFLVTTQSAQEVVDVADRVRAEAERVREETGEPARVLVDSADGATFPYAWYFRELDGVGYLDLSATDAAPDADIVVMTDRSHAELGDQLDEFEAERFPFRVWWVRDYAALTPRSFARWLLWREPWSDTGGLHEWLLIRRPQ